MSRSTDEQDGAGRLGRPASPSDGARGARPRWCCGCCGGEDIGEVSREIRVALPELERWRREFLEGGQQGVKKKNRPGGELMRTRAGGVDDAGRVAGGGYGDELRKLLMRLDG